MVANAMIKLILHLVLKHLAFLIAIYFEKEKNNINGFNITKQ